MADPKKPAKPKSRAKPIEDRARRLDGELHRSGDVRGDGPSMPPYEPTDEQRNMVKSMAGYGIRHIDIAKALGIDKKTVEKHFRAELDLGFGQAAANLGQTMYGQAMGVKDPNDQSKYIVPPSEKMLIFALERKFGYEAIERRFHSGPGGGPIQTEDVTDSMIDRLAKECSPEELEILERVFARGDAAPAAEPD